MEGLWKKIWSKSHQRDYWFNSATNEKSWSEPEEAKKERESRKRHHADVDANAGNEGIDNDNENSSRGGGKHNSIIASSTSPSSSSIPSALSSSSSAAKKQSLRPEVAIIVPYRDIHVEQKRKQHLDRFVQELPFFLSKSRKSFRIYIIEQSDDGRKFNRGKLLNIGYKIAKEEGNKVFIFHDVDLIPSENLLPYYTASQEEHPIHIARVWNRYNGNAKYFGGIVNFSSSQFEKINGFPNNFWGWGGEDDEMYKRVKEQGYRPTAPTSGSILDMEEMDLQSKLSFLKSHKLWKCMNKTEVGNDEKSVYIQ